MKHTTYKYKVIHSLKELEGKTIIEVVEIDAYAFIITNATILIQLDDYSGLEMCNWSELKNAEKLAFTNKTGITEDQLYPELD